MKRFITLIVFVGVVLILYSLQILRSASNECSKQFESNVVSIAQQAQAVFTDKQRSCMESYETLMSWDVCRQHSQRFIPLMFRSYAAALVNNFSLFVRDQEKDIEFYKRDHDERCYGYTYLMFYPPELE